MKTILPSLPWSPGRNFHKWGKNIVVYPKAMNWLLQVYSKFARSLMQCVVCSIWCVFSIVFVLVFCFRCCCCVCIAWNQIPKPRFFALEAVHQITFNHDYAHSQCTPYRSILYVRVLHEYTYIYIEQSARLNRWKLYEWILLITFTPWPMTMMLIDFVSKAWSTNLFATFRLLTAFFTSLACIVEIITRLHTIRANKIFCNHILLRLVHSLFELRMWFRSTII